MSSSVKRACAGLAAGALSLTLFGGVGAVLSPAAWGATVDTVGDGFVCPAGGGAKLSLSFSQKGVTGRTFAAYRIADLSADTSGEAVTYTVSEVSTPGVDAVVKQAVQSAGVTAKATGAESVASLTSDNWKTDKNSDIRKVATALDQVKGQLGSPVTITGNAGESDNLEAGVYLVVETTAASEKLNPSLSVPMIISTKYVQDSQGQTCYLGAAEVKNNDVTIDKKITDGTEPSNYETQHVSFTLTVPVPVRTGYQPGTFVFYVTDTLPDGLVFDDAKDTASVNGTSVSPRKTADKQTLVWNFSDRDLASADDRTLTASGRVPTRQDLLSGDTVTITYTVTVQDPSKFAAGNTGETNTAEVTYTNGPNSVFRGTDTEKVYQGEFTINKKDSAGAALSGATFSISSADGYNKTVVDGGDGDGDKKKEGTLTFSGLKASSEGVTYTVSEVSAPSGYAKISDFTLTVKLVDDKKGGKKVVYETTSAPSGVNLTSTEDRGAANVTDLTTVENLASTGGQVAGVLALAGVLAGTGVLVGRMRRRVQS